MSDLSNFNIIIDANKLKKDYFKDFFRYRELFYFIVWRDILVRYKQAVLGVLWAIIRPMLNILLFTLLFQRLSHYPSEGVPYSLFVLAGMLPWLLCSNAVIDCSHCLTNNAQLISKIYFPRMILPASQVIVHLVDFFIGVIVLVVWGLWLNALSGWMFIALPPFLLLALIFSLGAGFWMSSLMVKYRDFRFIVPLIVQFGVFISPVGYGSFLVPEEWQWVYFLNPVAGIIDGFRWAIFGITYPNIEISISFSILITSAVFISGFRYFRKVENTLVDRI